MTTPDPQIANLHREITDLRYALREIREALEYVAAHATFDDQFAPSHLRSLAGNLRRYSS